VSPIVEPELYRVTVWSSDLLHTSWQTRLLIVIYEDYAADPRMWRGYDPLIYIVHTEASSYQEFMFG
jgi:hypothetical protein